MDYIDILKTVVPYFGVFVGGFLSKRFLNLPPQTDKFLFKLFFHIFFPCLIINFIIGNAGLRDIASSIILPMSGTFSVVSGFIIAYLTAPLFGLRESVERRAFSYSVGVYNFGFFSLPIILHLFGRETAGQLLLFNFGIDLVYWTLGIMILTGSYRAGIHKLATSTPFYALFFSVGINTLFMPPAFSGSIASVLNTISFFTMPLGLFMSGMALGEGLTGANLKGTLKIGLSAIFMRMIVLAFMFLLIARYVEHRELKIIFAVQSSMPAGMLNLAVAKFFMNESRITSTVIVFTTVVSLVMMPFWLDFAFRFAGI